jgi:hypothetical protein
VRKSTRVTKKPAWLTSGEYVHSQCVVHSDWSERANFLQSFMQDGHCKGMESEVLKTLLGTSEVLFFLRSFRMHMYGLYLCTLLSNFLEVECRGRHSL